MNMEATESDYIVRFLLSLLETCCLQETVPGIISRIILNNLFLQIQDQEIELTPKHQEMAMEKVENIRTEILFDYVSKLRLTDRVNPQFYRDLAKKHVASNRYHEAALIIHKF